MRAKLLQLNQRIEELESHANEIEELVRKYVSGEDVQPNLNLKGQRWYRGSRELMVQHEYSGLEDFERSWISAIKEVIEGNVGVNRQHAGDWFPRAFRSARALVAAVIEEIKSRELPVKSQLSFDVSADEFGKALELLDASNGDEAILRASGVVARVALERHLFTVADARSITIQLSSPKKKPEAQDVLNTLAKLSVITGIQKSELESLFKVGNNCAHPKETVVLADVERLIKRGRELASVVV